MADRFRLIYLKSPGSEKSGFDRASIPPPSPRSPDAAGTTATTSPETFSFQAILKQVRTDLKHPDSKVKVLAIRYLERSDPSVAIPLLQEALSDRDSGVRLEALSSLMKFND